MLRAPGFHHLHPTSVVRFLEKPYGLGDTRAVTIEGPGLEAIELVETA